MKVGITDQNLRRIAQAVTDMFYLEAAWDVFSEFLYRLGNDVYDIITEDFPIEDISYTFSINLAEDQVSPAMDAFFYDGIPLSEIDWGELVLDFLKDQIDYEVIGPVSAEFQEELIEKHKPVINEMAQKHIPDLEQGLKDISL